MGDTSEIPKPQTLPEAIASCKGEASKKTDHLNWEVLDEVIGRLFDKDDDNDDIGTEEAILRAINSLENPVKQKMIDGLKERYGIKFEGLRGIDNDDKFDIDELLPKGTQEGLLGELERLSTIIETGDFEDFKKQIEVLSKNDNYKKILNLALKGLGFKEDVDSLLKDENFEKAFEKVQAQASNQEIASEEARKLQKEALPKSVGIEQLAVLNPDVSINVNQLLIDANGNKEVFISLLSDAYFDKIVKFYKNHKTEKKDETDKERTKTEQVEEITEQAKKQIEAKIQETINGMPLVIRNLLDPKQQEEISKAMENAEVFPEKITSMSIREKIKKSLQDVPLSDLNKALKKLVLENTEDGKRNREFLVAKMKTVEGSGYEDNLKRVKSYRDYVEKTGLTALDFGEWRAQQKIPFMENIMAVLKKLFGPLLKMLKEFMGKDDDEKEKPTKLEEIINKIEKKDDKETEKPKETKKDTEKAINELIEDQTRWEGVKIKEFKKDNSEDVDFEKVRTYFNKNNADENFKFMNSVLGADPNSMLGIARTKSLSLEQLRTLNEHSSSYKEKDSELLKKGDWCFYEEGIHINKDGETDPNAPRDFVSYDKIDEMFLKSN